MNARRIKKNKNATCASATAAMYDCKYVTKTGASYEISTTGSISLIPTIPTGADQTNRVGRDVVLKSVQVRGTAQNDSTATLNNCVVAVVYDRQTNKALPAITDIYESISSGSFIKEENTDRFLIIKEWRFTLTAVASMAVQADTLNVDQFLNLNNLPVLYSNLGTGAIDDIASGSLLFVTMGNQPSGTADAVMNASFRTYFDDN